MPNDQQQQQQPQNNNNRGRGRGRGRGGRGRGRSGGRGRGGRGGGRQSPQETTATTTTSSQRPLSQQISSTATPKLKNGEKGAEAHTVSESDRIKFTKILMDLREDDDRDKMDFSADLTNTERKFIHLLASQLGMVSKSSGKGEARKITVSKRYEQKKKTAFDDEDLPILKIGKQGMAALQQHMQRFPPTRTEEMESRETGASLVEAMKSQQNLTDTLQELNAGAPHQAHITQAKARHVDLQRRRERHAHFQSLKKGDDYQRILQNRSKLPAFARRQEIVAVIQNTPVTIIQGETGCGKSTQCPQFLLDAHPDANIAVTQPRRISAISIAERVAQEQCLLPSARNKIASGVGSLVGYQVRLEAAISRDTQLLFLTPGVLLRKLQSSPLLTEYTHIIIDEVHERDKYTAFLLIRLRDLLPLRPDLRLILMSATIQADVLMNYFYNAPDPYYQAHPPRMLSIEGRTFPVQEFFLEHVLELTNFIDIEAMDEAGDEDSPGMSMNQLDAAMAKVLTDGGGKPASSASEVTGNTVQCVMCGKRFPGSIQLGEHVAMCSGIDDDDVESDGGDIIATSGNGNQAKTATFSTAGMLHFLEQLESDDEAENFEDYAEYDVDEAAEVVEYQFQDIAGFLGDDEGEDNADNKWDGEGEFQADVEQAMDLSSKQENSGSLYDNA